MKKVVLFLGAGASKAFGFLLTSEILEKIIEGLDSDSDKPLFKDDRKKCIDLKKFLLRLMPGLTKTKQLPSITDILSLIDHLSLYSNSPWMLNDEYLDSKIKEFKNLNYYRGLLERAIFEVLDSLEVLDYTDFPRNLKKFIGWIYNEHKETYFTIITTNYDISIELALFKFMTQDSLDQRKYESFCKKIDFGFNWRMPYKEKICNQPLNPIFGIYKLHGSMNWLKCDLCDHIYINLYGTIYHQAFREELDNENTCECGNGPLKTVIVAPSFERDLREINLLHIWKNSMEALRTSEEWVIIGYSLPQEDLAIRSMLLRAYNGRVVNNKIIIPKITVVQNSDNDRNKYTLFFDERKDFKYFNEGFEKFLDTETEKTHTF